MPARSKAQQRAAGAALSAKRGKTPKSKLRGSSKQMEKSMTEKELEKFASTKLKGLPYKKSDKRTFKTYFRQRALLYLATGAQPCPCHRGRLG